MAAKIDTFTEENLFKTTEIEEFVKVYLVDEEDSPIRAMNAKVQGLNKEREQQGFPEVPNLSMGIPDFPPSKELINEVAEKWKHIATLSPKEHLKLFGYQNPRGGDATREKITQLYNNRYEESEIGDDNVMMFNGATHFSSTLFASLRSEKDGEKTKVAVFAPHFPTQKDQVEMNGKEFVPIRIKEGETPATAFSRTIEEEREKSANGNNLISAVFLSYPTNPTGSYFSKEELSDVMKVVEDQGDMMLGVERLYDKIADKPDDIVYPLQIDPKYHEKVPYAEAASLSKGYSLPGEHIAHGFASKEVMDIMGKVSFKTICGPSASAENTLRTVIDFEMQGKLDKWNEEMREHYMERVGTLNENIPDGFEVHPLVNKDKHGSFYVTMGAPDWVGKDIPDSVTHKVGEKTRKIDGIREKMGKVEGATTFKNGTDITKFLVEAEIGAFVPLAPFGLDEPYFRASCATDKDSISRAVSGMSSCNKGITQGEDIVIEHKEQTVTKKRSGSFADNEQSGARRKIEKSSSRVASLNSGEEKMLSFG